MPYAVIYTPEAEDQLDALFRYIAQEASVAVADRFTRALVDHCEGLATFPHRGASRDDIRPGIRLTHYRGRAAIVFSVGAAQVVIIGIFYGGQDYERLLRVDD